MKKQLIEVAPTMSEPDSSSATTPVSAARGMLRRPLVATLCLALVGALLMQLWRPLFHLTDDNLTGYLPVVVEACQRLWSGQSPFVNHSIFGGEYPLLRDATVFGMMSPYLLLVSPLAKTSWYYLIPDIVSTLNLITIAGAFCWSALYLRQRLRLEVSNGWIVFLSLSYTFTPFNFLVGSSWIGFVNPQASYPIVVAGLLHTNARKAVGLIGGGLMYGLFGGHLHPFLFLVLFGGILSIFLAWAEQSWRPVMVFAGGGTIAFLCALPILIPAFSGFSQSARGAGVGAEDASRLNVPPLQLVASFLLGPASSPIVPGARLHLSSPLFNTAIAFSVVNVPLVWILCRKRSLTRLEVGMVICFGLSALLVVRPQWLADVLAHAPLLRSLRWPFREIASLTFFAHLLVLLNLRADSWRLLRLPTALSVVFFALTFLNTAPSFNPFFVDRDLLISGKAKQFWTAIKGYYGEPTKIIVSAPPIALYTPIQAILPYTLLGSHNYAGLFGIVNVSGYSPTCAPTPLQPDIHPIHLSGAFLNKDAELICAKDPELIHVSLANVAPLRIVVSRGAVRHAFVFDPDSRSLREVPVPEFSMPAKKNE